MKTLTLVPRGMFRQGAFFFLLLSLPAAVILGLQRESSMGSDRRLEVMVGGGEVKALADQEGRSPGAVLREMKAAGVTALMVNDPPSQDTAPTAPQSRDVKLAMELGLRPVLMAGPFSQEPSGALSSLPEGSRPVVFFRDEVPAVWQGSGALPAFDELHPPLGLSHLATAGPRVLRIHQISAREAAALGWEAASLRAVRAVRERGARVIYLHLWVPGYGTETEEVPVAQAAVFNDQMIRGVRTELIRRGYVLGGAVPFRPLPGEAGWFWLITMGVAGALGLTGTLVCRRWEKAGWAAGVALPVVAALLWATGKVQWARDLTALAAAVAFPVLGVLTVLDAGVRDGPVPSCAKAVIKGEALWLVAAGIAVTGGCLAAGAMTTDGFLLQVEAFRGVKAALILPLLLVGRGLWERGVRPDWGDVRGWERWAVPALAMGAIGVYLIRSGNSPWIPVSHWENVFRLDLEKWFVIRPRFKEFLLGHPALAAGLIWLAGGKQWRRDSVGSRWLLPGVILLGTVGQASIVNTFLHLHTPWAVSLIRTGVGVALGVVPGLLGGIILLGWARRQGGEARVEGRLQRLLRL